MKTNISMPKHFWEVFEKTICIAEDFHKLHLEAAFTKLFSNAFVSDNTIVDVKGNSEKIVYHLKNAGFNELFDVEYTDVQTLKEKFTFKNGVYDLDEKDLSLMATLCDLVMRVWLGQWGELVTAFSFQLKTFDYKARELDFVLADIRNKMLPIFVRESITSPYASFGIYNKDLSEDIRIVYALYKKIRFSTSGHSDDSYICGKDYTKEINIELPIKGEYISDGNKDGVKEFLNSFKIEYDAYTYSKKLSYVEENEDLYVYVNETISVRVEEGTKIIIGYNRWPIIERDGQSFDFDSKV